MKTIKIFFYLLGFSLFVSLLGTALTFLINHLVYLLGLPLIFLPIFVMSLLLGLLVIVSIYLGRKPCCQED